MIKFLAASPFGRIALHLLCALRNPQCRSHWEIHWEGIQRELTPPVWLFLLGVAGLITSAIALCL